MADQVTVQGENTPEHVASRLMDKIFIAENKSRDNLTREEILTTYLQCRLAVGGHYVTQEQAKDL